MAKKNATQDPGMPMPILNRIEEDLVPTVDARALHKWLEAGAHFTDWMHAQIELADLVENSDYCTVHEKVKLQFGPIQMAVEYFLTRPQRRTLTARIPIFRFNYHSREKELCLAN
jgi:hypothetical protein